MIIAVSIRDYCIPATPSSLDADCRGKGNPFAERHFLCRKAILYSCAERQSFNPLPCPCPQRSFALRCPSCPASGCPCVRKSALRSRVAGPKLEGLGTSGEGLLTVMRADAGPHHHLPPLWRVQYHSEPLVEEVLSEEKLLKGMREYAVWKDAELLRLRQDQWLLSGLGFRN